MLLSLALLLCISGDKAGKANPDVTRADIERTVAYLASDELEGRDTGSAGAEKAAKFLADALARAGVEPAGDKGTWLQQVPITRTTFREVPRLSVWTEDGKERECVAGIDFDWNSGAPGTKRLRARVVTKDEEMLGFQDDEVALFLDGSMQDRRRWLSASKGIGFGLVITPGSDKPGTTATTTPPRPQTSAGAPEVQPAGQLRVHGETVVCILPGHESEIDEFQCDRELLEISGQWVVKAIENKTK